MLVIKLTKSFHWLFRKNLFNKQTLFYKGQKLLKISLVWNNERMKNKYTLPPETVCIVYIKRLLPISLLLFNKEAECSKFFQKLTKEDDSCVCISTTKKVISHFLYLKWWDYSESSNFCCRAPHLHTFTKPKEINKASCHFLSPQRTINWPYCDDARGYKFPSSLVATKEK